MTRGTLGPIAIDISAHDIRAVQLRSGRGRERLSSWARLPRANAEWGVREVRNVWESLRRQGFVGEKVALVMPASDASACFLEFRGRSAREVDDLAVRGELARMHRIESGTFEYCAWKSPGSGRARASENWLAVCTPHSKAEALVAPFDTIGCQIVGIDAGCFSLARAAWNRISPSSLGVVVHLSRECARFVAVVDEGVVYERLLTNLGWNRVFERSKTQLGLDENVTNDLLRTMARQESRRASVQAGAARLRPYIDEHMRALALELRHSVNYLEGGYSHVPLIGIAITGEGSAIGGWIKAVQSGSGVQVRALGARDIIDGADTLDDELGADLVLAIGLARYPQLQEVAA